MGSIIGELLAIEKGSESGSHAGTNGIPLTHTHVLRSLLYIIYLFVSVIYSTSGHCIFPVTCLIHSLK